MGFREVMALPVVTFWMLHANIDRLEAEESQRLTTIGMISQSDGKTAEKFMEDLSKRKGDVIVFDGATPVAAPPSDVMNAKFDRAGFSELKGLGRL